MAIQNLSAAERLTVSTMPDSSVVAYSSVAGEVSRPSWIATTTLWAKPRTVSRNRSRTRNGL
jgi:hypothetical protein